jgi:hypothetical protein
MTGTAMKPGGLPAWLPALHTLASHGGNWSEYEEALYETYTNDFVKSKPKGLGGRRWALKRHPLEKGKEATFWHLISEGEDEEERLPHMGRCERLCWVRPLIDHFGSPDVYAWEQRRRANERRLALSLVDFSFVVILADRTTYVLPWTAFPVEREHRRAKLRAEYNAFAASKKPLF